jgi:hypothetical protein
MAVGLGGDADDLICKALIGEAFTNYASANAHLGVGDSTTAYAAGQTDLQAASNKLRKGMYDGTFPSRSNNVITFKSRFTDSEAVWDWNEIGIFNAAAAGVMLTRDVPASSLGSKPNNQTWDLTVALTIS